MKPNIPKDNMNHVLTISLIVPSEEFELEEILIRDRDVFKTFDEATVKAIQEEVGLSAGLLPKLSERQIESMRIGEEVSIEKLEDIPSVDSQAFGSYFADVYLNGTYKWEDKTASRNYPQSG